MGPLTGGKLVMLEGVRTDFDLLRGRLYELVELLGMSDRQEEAFKRLVRRQTSQVQSRLEIRLRGEEVT